MEFTEKQLDAMRDYIRTTGVSTKPVPPGDQVHLKGSAMDKTYNDLLKIIDAIEQNHMVTITLARPASAMGPSD